MIFSTMYVKTTKPQTEYVWIGLSSLELQRRKETSTIYKSIIQLLMQTYFSDSLPWKLYANFKISLPWKSWSNLSYVSVLK